MQGYWNSNEIIFEGIFYWNPTVGKAHHPAHAAPSLGLF